MKENRKSIKIPVQSRVYEYLESIGNGKPAWQVLDELVATAPDNKESKMIRIFDKFVSDFCEVCPDKSEELNYLRPLILKKILNGACLDDEYYQKLKKM